MREQTADSKKRIVSQLRRTASTVPTTVKEAWWLAMAIGYGRLLDLKDQAEGLAVAEQTLAEVDAAVLAELSEALDWAGTLDEIATGLQQERPEEFEAALASAEELLAIGEVLGEQQAVERFLEEVEQLVAWVSPEWNHFGSTAMRRFERLNHHEMPVAQLWETVADAATSALIRETEPREQPEAKLVDEMLPEQSPIDRWQERLADVVDDTVGELNEWVTEALDGFVVEQPAPVMNEKDESAQDSPRLVTQLPRRYESYRAFIVDEDYPHGYEVTDWLSVDDTNDIWRLETPDQKALVILIGSLRPIDGESLKEVVTEAAHRDDVVIESRKVSQSR